MLVRSFRSATLRATIGAALLAGVALAPALHAQAAPPVRLTMASVTPTEYVNTSMAYLGAQMAYGFAKSMKGYKVPAEDVENVAFVRVRDERALSPGARSA